MYSVMNRTAPEAPLHAAQIPTTLINSVMSCLAKKQDIRPRDASELITLLSQSFPSSAIGVAFRTVSEDDPPVFRRDFPAKRSSSHPIAWGASLAVLGVVALLGWTRHGEPA